jgi:hypothetical protein
MGTNGTKKNTGKSNTDAEDKIDDIPSMLRPPQKISPSSTTYTSDSTRTRSPRTQAIEGKLWKGQKLTDEIFTGKNSNPSLGKTTLLEEDMYNTHRIRHSPSTSAPKRPPTAKKSSESGGKTRNRLRVASLNCWGTDTSSVLLTRVTEYVVGPRKVSGAQKKKMAREAH